MIRFKQLFLERTFPNELYHGTSLNSLVNIIKQDKIHLSYTGIEGPDKSINKDKDFFLSMSYDKYGRYVNLGNPKVSGNPTFTGYVIMVMNTFALRDKGKLIDAEYWSGSYSQSEKEVRYISNEPTLNDVSKYVDEVHIYLDPIHWFNAQERDLKGISHIINSDVETYLYNDSKPFRMMLKQKAITLDKFKQMVVNIERKRKEPSKYRGEESITIKDFRAIYNIVMGIEPNTEEEKKSHQTLKDWFRYDSWSDDARTFIKNTIHNVRRDRLPEFDDFTKRLRELKIRNAKDLSEYIRNKFKNNS